MTRVNNGVVVSKEPKTENEIARKNIGIVLEFFSLYLGDKERFYSLWAEDDPQVLTPYMSSDVATLAITTHAGWSAVKGFWDPIFDEMKGRFDWFVNEIIPGEDPDTIVVRSRSEVDVDAGETWGNKHVAYSGRYVQIFRFDNGKVKSFEEYYDTSVLNAAYGA